MLRENQCLCVFERERERESFSAHTLCVLCLTCVALSKVNDKISTNSPGTIVFVTKYHNLVKMKNAHCLI